MLTRFGSHFAGRFPEPECAVGDHEFRSDREATPLEIEQQIAPVMRTFPGAVGKTDGFLLAFRRRTDDDEDALLLVFEAGLQVDAISPDVDVALGREIALLPRDVIILPAILEAAYG